MTAKYPGILFELQNEQKAVEIIRNIYLCNLTYPLDNFL